MKNELSVHQHFILSFVCIPSEWIYLQVQVVSRHIFCVVAAKHVGLFSSALTGQMNLSVEETTLTPAPTIFYSKTQIAALDASSS